MCGRYLLTSPVEALRQLFMFEQRPNLMPRYNIAPTQDVPSVRLTRDGDGRELIMVRWGLVPFWADDLTIGNRLINARCESVHSARAFREAYSRRRCLVPADGFFEWQKQGKLLPPFLIRWKDQVPFAFAGLWERWKDRSEGTVVRSCTIITCPANDLVAPLHDRMPVILAPEAHANGSTRNRMLEAYCGPTPPHGWRRSRSTGESTARRTTTRSVFNRPQPKIPWPCSGWKAVSGARPSIGVFCHRSHTPFRYLARAGGSSPRARGTRIVRVKLEPTADQPTAFRFLPFAHELPPP
jgi:putative SOS response-associated peptidase YedK